MASPLRWALQNWRRRLGDGRNQAVQCTKRIQTAKTHCITWISVDLSGSQLYCSVIEYDLYDLYALVFQAEVYVGMGILLHFCSKMQLENVQQTSTDQINATKARIPVEIRKIVRPLSRHFTWQDRTNGTFVRTVQYHLSHQAYLSPSWPKMWPLKTTETCHILSSCQKRWEPCRKVPPCLSVTHFVRSKADFGIFRGI